jgi:hypothetical protein
MAATLKLRKKSFLKKDDLKPSQNAWDWLGHGIYFWEDSPSRAEQWAHEENRRAGSPTKNPAVVGAVIALGNCLNLADVESLKQVRAAHHAYLNICAETGAPVAKNRGLEMRARFLDCAVMETLHQLRKAERQLSFDTVRGFFMEGRELYDGAGFRELDHIQVCVRSPKQIIGYFWPRQMAWPSYYSPSTSRLKHLTTNRVPLSGPVIFAMAGLCYSSQASVLNSPR